MLSCCVLECKIIIKRDFLCNHFQPIPQEDHYELKKINRKDWDFLKKWFICEVKYTIKYYLNDRENSAKLMALTFYRCIFLMIYGKSFVSMESEN